MRSFTKTYLAVIIAIAAIFISGCASLEKQRFKAEKFYRQNPKELAAICATNFPPKYTPGKEVEQPRDTVYMPGDSIPCPPVVNPQTGKTETPKVQCPPSQKIYIPSLRVDTVQDPAMLAQIENQRYQIGALRLDLDKAVDKRQEAEKSQKEAENKTASKQWIIYGLLAAVAFLLFRLFKK